MRIVLIFIIATAIIFISIPIIYHFIEAITKFYNYIKDLTIEIKENFKNKGRLKRNLDELMNTMFLVGYAILVATIITICLFAMIFCGGAGL
ncbi:hypothetical protein IX329_000766 [Fusobacterium necrophorum]|nr:hypothetical protein [Fusobacterium necrophorum]MBR8733193.1 hypothetical protein [Fusobacterium necrophorum]MBR8789263.1 hypothetical protein [Fusobacterium necrophorum]MDY2572719.1 hypothetical protein [Fusobacterium necrophorum]